MKRGIPVFFILMTLLFIASSSCTSKREPVPAEEAASDSVVQDTDTVAADTLEQIISETPMPKAADELFDDFFFNFTANKNLQYERITFPLIIYKGDVPSDTITKDEWKMDRFFMHQGFYTILFDSEKQMDVVKDTKINSVTVEKISLKRDSIKQYVFERNNGAWVMSAIKNVYLEDYANASFLKFYGRFVSDSEFQKESLSNPIVFVGPDPQDDFGDIVTTTINPEDWADYAPEELPSETIYNIIYGQVYGYGSEKIFVIKGISNGFETRLDFKRVNNHWKLIQLSI